MTSARVFLTTPNRTLRMAASISKDPSCLPSTLADPALRFSVAMCDGAYLSVFR
jgi:hypothetical protein